MSDTHVRHLCTCKTSVHMSDICTHVRHLGDTCPAERTARGLELRAEYWRTSEFSRRNARGRSAQFMERPLRQSLFGRYYVEADVEAAHPTMAATAMRWAGLEATGWSELAADAQEYRRRIVEEYRRLGCAVTTSEVKRGITILLNGGSIVRWATEAAGRPVVAESLTALRAEILRFRNIAQRAFPKVSAVIQEDGRQRTAEQVRSSVVHAVMTGLEDRVLHAMEMVAGAQGWECAALLGDGMMVRPAAGVWPESWQLVSDSWQRAVFESTGIRVKIAFKSLDGQRADAWALALRRCNSDPRVAVAQ